MITAENRQLVREFKAVGCGSCKATGEEHEWNADADLVPTGRTCKVCDGTGIAPPKRSPTTGAMVTARRIVEDHIEAYGMVPHPDKLKDEIATQIALAEIRAADKIAASR